MTNDELYEDIEHEIRRLDIKEMTTDNAKEKAEIRKRKASTTKALEKLKRRLSRKIEKAVFYDD